MSGLPEDTNVARILLMPTLVYYRAYFSSYTSSIALLIPRELDKV